MDGDKNACDSSLSQSGGHFKPTRLSLDLWHIAIFSGASDHLRARLHLHLVLHDILIHHTIVELGWVLQSIVVVDFTVLWLDEISLFRIYDVSERVILLTQLTALHLLVEHGLVIPGCLLLLHEPTCG